MARALAVLGRNASVLLVLAAWEGLPRLGVVSPEILPPFSVARSFSMPYSALGRIHASERVMPRSSWME